MIPLAASDDCPSLICWTTQALYHGQRTQSGGAFGGMWDRLVAETLVQCGFQAIDRVLSWHQDASRRRSSPSAAPTKAPPARGFLLLGVPHKSPVFVFSRGTWGTFWGIGVKSAPLSRGYTRWQWTAASLMFIVWVWAAFYRCRLRGPMAVSPNGSSKPTPLSGRFNPSVWCHERTSHMKLRIRRFLTILKKPIGIVLLGLTALTVAVTNLDSLATTWVKHFGQSSEITALEDAINQTLAPPSPSAVTVELVQMPREQNDSQIFDVYLKNTSSDDILLTSLTYGSGFVYTSQGITGSEKFFPDSSYTIPVKGGSRHSAALSPPFLLKASSRSGIRFNFAPEDRPRRFASTTLAFELYDSTGQKVASVNGFIGN